MERKACEYRGVAVDIVTRSVYHRHERGSAMFLEPGMGVQWFSISRAQQEMRWCETLPHRALLATNCRVANLPKSSGGIRKVSLPRGYLFRRSHRSVLLVFGYIQPFFTLTQYLPEIVLGISGSSHSAQDGRCAARMAGS